MLSDDELRAELNELAEQTAIEPTPLDSVQTRSRRRALYQRGGIVLAAFALVVGGTVVVTSMGGDDGLDVATEEADTVSTDEQSDEAEAEAADGAAADGEDAEATSEADSDDPAAESVDDMAEATESVASGSIAFDEAGYAGPQQVVPWGDGFLAFGERFIETEPSELVFDGSGPIGDYFSQEIIDVVNESGVTTIDEAMGVLEAAGLLEEATEIVTENPEVLEWFNTNVGGGQYVPYAEYSADGVAWEPLEDFSWPGPNSWYSQIASNGSHLVLAEHQSAWDPETNRPIPSPIVVHVTTDLVTWSSFEVPYVPPAVPDYVQLNVSPQQLVVTEDSWLLTVSSWQWIDIWTALPDDVLDELNLNGYDAWPTEDGLEIVDWSWEEYDIAEASASESSDDAGDAEPALAVEPSVWEESEPTVVRVIPWSELPFTFEEYNGADGQGDTQAFLGNLDSGAVVEVESPGSGDETGQIVVTDAGLFTIVWDYPEFEGDAVETTIEADYRPTVSAWFSAEGRGWQERDLPPIGDDEWIDAAVAVEDGLLLTMSAGRSGQRFFVGAADGTGFGEVDGPELPENAHVWFPSHHAMGDGAASVIDLGSASQQFFPAYEVTFTQDEFEITTIQDGDGNGSITVRDAGGEVVYEHSGHVYDEPPFRYDDTGVSIVGDDGEVIVSIPHEVMEREVWRVESQAWDDYHRDNPYIPDFWLIATRDGRSWTVVQLPALEEEYGWYGDAVVSGDRVLVADGMGDWQSIPLN